MKDKDIKRIEFLIKKAGQNVLDALQLIKEIKKDQS
jgi:hypothetical protein